MANVDSRKSRFNSKLEGLFHRQKRMLIYATGTSVKNAARRILDDIELGIALMNGQGGWA